MRLAFALVAVVALLNAAAAPAGGPGRQGEIAFVTERVIAKPGLVSLEVDGSSGFRIPGTAGALTPVVSARGSMLAWSSGQDVWVSRSDGGHGRDLGPVGYFPSFDPGGAHVAVRTPDNDDLAVVDTTTGAATEIVHARQIYGAPAWSPDAAWIAFVEHVAGAQAGTSTLELHVVRPDGSDDQAAPRHGHGPGHHRVVAGRDSARLLVGRRAVETDRGG
jgi:hypothetical protein